MVQSIFFPEGVSCLLETGSIVNSVNALSFVGMIGWFHHWKFNLALFSFLFFSFVYLTATDQVFIQMKASRSHLLSKFQIFSCLLPDLIVCAFVLWKNHGLYVEDKKRFWGPFAVDKSLGHRMKCVCVCLITECDQLKCCMQFVCWIVIKFFFSFSFPPFFPSGLSQKIWVFWKQGLPWLVVSF